MSFTVSYIEARRKYPLHEVEGDGDGDDDGAGDRSTEYGSKKYPLQNRSTEYVGTRYSLGGHELQNMLA